VDEARHHFRKREAADLAGSGFVDQGFGFDDAGVASYGVFWKAEEIEEAACRS
jgi:hypothetical protein